MNKEMGIAAIVLICVLVLGIGLVKQKAEALLNAAVRVLAGAAAIYAANTIIAAQGSSVTVGMNPISLLTVGVLGAGGFGLLYGIVF